MEHLYWCIGYDMLLPDIVKSEGSYLYDSNGKKYVDLESGVWCTPLGHSNPEVNQAIKSQIEKISHTGYCYTSPITDKAANDILQITDIADGKCVFLSSGSEAVEFGVQIIRKLTERPFLLSLSDSFLGSYGSAGEKGKSEWYSLNWERCRSCPRMDDCDPQCSLIAEIPFDQIGGFVFEPGSASGFVRFPPQALIKNLVKLIKDHNGFWQINEITTGIGRTGRWFGYQHYNLKPDIISMGKGLGNGYPVSAVAMSEDIVNKLKEKSFIYSQSHQNDPLGSAVASRVVSVIREQQLIERCEEMGRYCSGELEKLGREYNCIKEIRSKGLMIAIEFDTYENISVSMIFRDLLDRGYIIAYGSNFLRLDPSLLIKKEDIEGFIVTLKQVLDNYNS